MKKNYITIIALLAVLASHAQKGTQKFVAVSGLIEDAATHEPLTSATARITGLNRPGNNYVTTADSTGHFTIFNVLPGAYKLSVEFIGYAAYYSDIFRIDTSKTEWSLQPVYLKTDSKTLKTVIEGTNLLLKTKLII